MKNGRFEQKHPRRRNFRRAVLPLLLIALILSITVGGTLAYIMVQTSGVENSFTPAQVSCTVVGDEITNTSNVKAYIRAMVIVNWMDSAGNVSAIAPAYKFTPNSGWQLDETTGIYYYNSDVAPDGEISVPGKVQVTDKAPAEEYTLSVEIVAEAIQAEGMNATSAQDAWAKAKGQ